MRRPSLRAVPDQRTHGDDWDIHDGPDRIVPLWYPDVSAAWVWTLRNRRTGDLAELVVTVRWRGFDSIAEVSSPLTKEAFATKGRIGVDWFLAKPSSFWHFPEGWTTVIFHSQTRQIHGSWTPPQNTPPEIKRIDDPD
jgi:hypothetical protein